MTNPYTAPSTVTNSIINEKIRYAIAEAAYLATDADIRDDIYVVTKALVDNVVDAVIYPATKIPLDNEHGIMISLFSLTPPINPK